MLAGNPLTADDLKVIPADAVFAGALRLDLVKAYLTLTSLIEKADPNTGEQIKQAAGMTQALGFRLQEDVLGSFGDVWTYHSVPPSSSGQAPGLVVTVTVKNKETLLKIQALALGMIKAQAGKVPWSVSDTKIGDLPAWQVVPRNRARHRPPGQLRAAD